MNETEREKYLIACMIVDVLEDAIDQGVIKKKTVDRFYRKMSAIGYHDFKPRKLTKKLHKFKSDLLKEMIRGRSAITKFTDLANVPKHSGLIKLDKIESAKTRHLQLKKA